MPALWWLFAVLALVAANRSFGYSKTTSWETSKSNVTLTVTISETLTEPVSGQFRYRYNVTAHGSIMKKAGQPAINGTYGVMGWSRVLTNEIGDRTSLNMSNVAFPGGTQWTGQYTNTISAGVIYGSTGTGTAYNRMTSFTVTYKTEADNSDEGHFLTFTLAAGEFGPNPPPGKVQPEAPTRKGPTQKVTNPYKFPIKIEYKDAVTGETLSTLTLGPGETGLAGITKTGTNPVTENITFPEGAVVNGTDTEGNPVLYGYPPGHTITGKTIPDSEFVPTGEAPTWSPPQTSVPPIPPVSGATMTPNPGGPTVPQVAQPKANNPVDGNAGRVQYSGAGAGTGGATDNSLREGVGAIVSKLTDIEGKMPDVGEVGAPGDAGTDPAGEEVVETRVGDPNKVIDSSVPEYFQGGVGSNSVVSATFSMFNGTRTWTFDAAQFAGPISFFRALLSVIVHYSMFVLVTKTGRAAAAA